MLNDGSSLETGELVSEIASRALPAQQLSPSVPHPLEILALFERLQTSCWLAGAAASDAEASVRPATYANTKLVSLAVALVRSQANDFSFNSLAIFDELRSPPHVDARNDQYAFNVVIPLSSFTGGDIVLRKPATLQALPVAAGPVAFQAARYEHWVAPWKGRRTVLVAFTSKVQPLRRPCDEQFLRSLAFPLPLGPIDPSGLPPVFRAQWPPSSGAVTKPQQATDVSDNLGSRTPATAVPLSQRARRSASGFRGSLPHQELVPHGHGAQPSFVEICAGCARLSHVMRAHGFRAYPIDQPSNMHKELHACLHIDVTLPAQQRLCKEFPASAKSLAAVHLGLPCGTCCRARERARHLRGKFARPKPLGGARFPLGIPSLSGVNASRVHSANRLYEFALSILPDLLDKHICVSIENPRRSWLWPALRALAKSMGPRYVQALALLQPIHYGGCTLGGAQTLYPPGNSWRFRQRGTHLLR